jgi:hypothetical protein
MEYISIALVAVFVILLVSYPLSGRQRQLHRIEDVFDPGDTKQLNFLNSKRASIANNIRELEFEHEMGKLSEQDYAALRQGYDTETAEITAAIDKFRVKKEIEDLIEEEVRSKRRIK